MSKKKIEQGFQMCCTCLRVKPLTEFNSNVQRRKKLTVKCKTCRVYAKKTREKGTTSLGKCREFWISWKKQHKCVDCGLEDSLVMEADHVIGNKLKHLSYYNWWVSHGGVEAMKDESKKCEPRCRFCHAIKTKERYERKPNKKVYVTRSRRNHEINLIKCKIGECKTCKRKVTLETCVGFDFDHRDEEKKVICISQIPFKKKEDYEKYLKTEIPKCDLLCKNCHKIKTVGQDRLTRQIIS